MWLVVYLYLLWIVQSNCVRICILEYRNTITRRKEYTILLLNVVYKLQKLK